ncbi:unnamed protein product [Macrosiphum euphorbiae]|uniref:Helitron helicase-like domain-containing protein n=1 Tax=Macrosiphum euphorbiae TaxID=13131 RepID=A0AAV0WKB8_9HEMI|nr:unnamed protein product [Macrosiphum euphorbiae]
MDVICQYCNAMKFKGESAGMCCSNGTVRIPNIDEPPEPMKTLLESSTNISKHFLENITKYNNAFHMTSFGAAETIVENYMPTFKIRGQVYHLAGSLMPLPNTNHKYLQVYFMDDEEEQIDARMGICSGLNKVEMAVVMIGEEYGNRDIVLSRKDEKLQRISETHRSYDSLEYPLIFLHGEDGYAIDILSFNVNLNEYNSHKTISSKQFYAYRLMVRHDIYNHLHNYRQLINKYWVDIAEDYIHLRDAIENDGHVNDIGQLFILPSSFTGGPRYMHEKTMDAMTYVRNFGTPNLFITFTCNPNWMEIKRELKHGQTAQDRHDIIARWQKRGLPHAHLLVWLVDKIRPNDVDVIISAELPNPEIDPELFEIVKKHMVHGPCGHMNPNSPCMGENQKCSKRYPKAFTNSTITEYDGYPCRCLNVIVMIVMIVMLIWIINLNI